MNGPSVIKGFEVEFTADPGNYNKWNNTSINVFIDLSIALLLIKSITILY